MVETIKISIDDIEFDTNNDVDLPSKFVINIPSDITIGGIHDFVINVISNHTGYCVNNFSFNILNFNQPTVEITKKSFLDWYFFTGSDEEKNDIIHNLGEIVQMKMLNNNKAEFDVEDLFRIVDVGQINARYFKGFSLDRDEPIYKIVSEDKIKLVDS